MTTVADVRERLTEIRPPGLGRDISAAGLVKDVRVEDGTVTVHVLRGTLPAPVFDATVTEIRHAVGALEGVTDVEVHTVTPPAHDESTNGEGGPIPGVSDIVAVSSTKGGVGKSTLAVNVACALLGMDQRVGILDADVYGPSLPTMLGLSGRPRVVDKTKIFPLEKHGLKAMSMGFFLDDRSPVIWRGPLVTGLLRQFLKDVQWGELDVLVLDLPPGTGDAVLTLAQQVPLSGAVVVTTPQDVALLDVERGVAMFDRVNTPVIGIVENMSAYVCPHCGETDPLFGSGGGARLGQDFGVPLLGQIPLVSEIRVSGDAGTPLVIGQPDHPVTMIYRRIAEKILESLASEREQASSPRIVG